MRTRSTAVCIFGSKKGSLNVLRRGRKYACTSSELANPLRLSSRAMHGDPQISVHEIGPLFSSSGGAIIHRLCTDHFIRGELPDKMRRTLPSGSQSRSTRQTAVSMQRAPKNRSSKMRLVRWLALICVVLLLVYGVSPYFSFWRFTVALRAGDSAALSARVD